MPFKTSPTPQTRAFRRLQEMAHESFRLFSSVPQRDLSRIADLELMPLRMNGSQSNRLTERPNALEARLRQVGLFKTRPLENKE
jgi:hypothetical protein